MEFKRKHLPILKTTNMENSKSMQLNYLQNQINKKKRELFELQKQFENIPKLILMYRKNKGKHTFVYQPKKQIHSLASNGWEIIENLDKKIKSLGLNK